jgi:hypothetical protein
MGMLTQIDNACTITGQLRAQIAAKDAEIARLRKALLTCATIPHMGQYTGSQVNAAIEESKPWE